MPHGAYSPVYLEGCGKWKKRLAGPVERFFLRRAKRIIATCGAEREWIERYLGQRSPPVDVVDLKKFFRLERGGHERRDGREGRPVHLLYLGRRHPLKGVDILERAVRGMEGVELRIESGLVGEEKESAWAWCDVLVLPTLSENFGLVVAEALERGKRVITTDGAPAWRGQEGVAYVEGFRDGSDERRVELLREAIAGACASM
jgi:glycosyltransferase involved in cell wall biosynthesis